MAADAAAATAAPAAVSGFCCCNNYARATKVLFLRCSSLSLLYGTRFPQGYGLWALTLLMLGPVYEPVPLKVDHARAGVAHAR